MAKWNDYSVLILAGGKNSRMGSSKAEMLYRGKTFTENLIEKACALDTAKVYISGYEHDDKRISVVWDEYPEKGPMSGMHACMKRMDTPYALVLPVDVPQVPEKLLENLLKAHSQLVFTDPFYSEQAFVLEHGRHVQPLIGIYPIKVVPQMEDLLKNGHTGVFRFIKSYGYCAFHGEIPQWTIANINTMDQYEQLLAIDEKIRAMAAADRE